MRTGDDVGGDELADAAGGIGTGINGGFHAADVAFDEHGDEGTTDLDLVDKLDVGGFGHRVSGFDAADVAFGFNHAECTHSIMLGGVVGDGGCEIRDLKFQII